ncbi:MAG TPA: LysR family transcriptional regulator [Desulfobacteraceae bacterium]|nr:LysR family transcriptional regulator [Desulfobacteraceae bacterium]HPJ67983.1 LysR family transcriptional regulator [Desulfobacteraceae bacterium]HPQ28278.1 LysR family transcriptional regulator [Desulfobacteraceae bacterium]
MINFNQIRVFYHVAKNQSFTLAAKDLFITQPAVTAQVKAFEDFCNLKLFKKRGRGIYLTDEGTMLYHSVRQIFEYEKEIENVIDDMRKLKRGVLRLGTTKAYARYLMPFLMSHFHRIYPQIKIFLDEGTSLEMNSSLLNFKNEVAIIARAQDHPDITFIPFSQEELVLIMHPNHPFVKLKEVSVGEIAREPIIMKQAGSGTRTIVDQLFIKNGCIPNILMETGNTEFIKDLVCKGEGVSFLVRPSVNVEFLENKLVTVPVKGHKIFLKVSIAYLKDQVLSNTARAFVDLLLQLAPKDGPLQDIATLSSKLSPVTKIFP